MFPGWRSNWSCSCQPMPQQRRIQVVHSSWQHQILNPLSEARDQTCNLMVPSLIRFHCTTMGTPRFLHFMVKACFLLYNTTRVLFRIIVLFRIPNTCFTYSLTLSYFDLLWWPGPLELCWIELRDTYSWFRVQIIKTLTIAYNSSSRHF